MLEQMDTDVVQLEQDQDTNLMPKDQNVTPLASPNPRAKKVPSDQGDTEILEDNLEENEHNISFNKSQHRVLQLHRVSTPDVHVSRTFSRMSDHVRCAQTSSSIGRCYKGIC